MNKNIKDYLPFYLGCEMYKDGYSVRKLTPLVLMEWDEHYRLFKLLLRPLSDMKEDDGEFIGGLVFSETVPKEEKAKAGRMYILYYLDNLSISNSGHELIEDFDASIMPEATRYLLSKGFDLFGLIESGLAIDKTTLKQTA